MNIQLICLLTSINVVEIGGIKSAAPVKAKVEVEVGVQVEVRVKVKVKVKVK